MKAVITGATGAIGIALIKELVLNKDEVLVICHRNSKRIENIPCSPYVKTLELNMEEYRTYEPEIKGYDVFYHMAWEGTAGEKRFDVQLQYENIGFALDAVRLAKKLGCNTFIGAGSQAEYGRVEGKLSADTPAFPENAYGAAKLCTGQMTRKLCEELGIRHIWARILSVYGPFDSEYSMIMTSVRKLLKKEIPQFTKGEQQWDYLFSSDAARALYLLAQKGRDGKIYPIGSGKTKALREYIEQLRNAVNSEAEIAIGALDYQEKQVMYLCADIEELHEDTGFYPEIDFKDGIAQVVNWLRSEGDKDD